ncbi:hypothetical protein CFHF_07830 [Caulobacter flavus]|jgi:hypothetical protein|uniref:Chromosome partitioning protein ParB n=1 Tax=Caulobacter flavus TaxID=1679497 RepID=A0A2N5CW04_9CAUL|nr:hypothetical protein [Caulobacter flavus]AYV48245.1 hypothetical protein C1707_19360 [Caulobacter flavus]PLR17997.1 hypothetical protein CFHF_07830 [Caulobacter flavus]
MSRERPTTGGFAARPSAADRWVKSAAPPPAKPYSARLTVDITPALRARIKIIAIERGLTLSDMVRDLLEATYGLAESTAP